MNDKLKDRLSSTPPPASKPAAGRKARAAKPAADEPAAIAPPPAPKLDPNVLAYFDTFRGGYYVPNAFREFMPVPVETVKNFLRTKGYNKDRFAQSSLNEIEDKILSITLKDCVHFAGPLGGYLPGLYDISGCRVLVTHGPRFITPKRGGWPWLRDLLKQLLGKQNVYFLAWVKWALESIRRGSPWSPGQMLAVAGPPGCGKSLLQGLITPMLGGRVAKPYKYMVGDTPFNSEMFGAEHNMIEDEVASHDPRDRRKFGAAVKSLVVNKEQFIHGKGKTAITLTPFLRLTMTLNDEPEALLALPHLDGDVKDKIMLIHARETKLPFPSEKFPTSQCYRAALQSELPAFLYDLLRWEIPEEIRDQRYGVVSYHHPELIREVDDLSPELKLMGLIELHGLLDGELGCWTGTAQELERDLRTRDKTGEPQRLFSYNSACGQYLSRLRTKMPERISFSTASGNRKIWTILG